MRKIYSQKQIYEIDNQAKQQIVPIIAARS